MFDGTHAVHIQSRILGRAGRQVVIRILILVDQSALDEVYRFT